LPVGDRQSSRKQLVDYVRSAATHNFGIQDHMTQGLQANAVVVMGVSGCGKSTIGALLADSLGLPFLDADGLHPQANILKMASGIPLTDDDRWPWLALVGDALASAGASGTGLVIACSALKQAYREAIRASAPNVRFVHLSGSLEVLSNRLEGRSEHFMPSALLASQLAALEELRDDEPGFAVDIDQPVTGVVTEAAARLRASG
jgi:carbohydrate kinase (thermoresistant glucokinase family)